MASSGFMRLSTFSRRSGSIAASSRTSLSRVFHFAYLLQPMPAARSAEIIQTVMSVAVTRSIKNRKCQRQLIKCSGKFDGINPVEDFCCACTEEFWRFLGCHTVVVGGSSSLSIERSFARVSHTKPGMLVAPAFASCWSILRAGKWLTR
jgi:hypothetical protein